jgi:phage replication O-like protein O
MSTVKPFDRGFFAIHNAVFDVMMPDLSPNAFKVLCVAIRQTMGWNRQADTISFSQFREKAGIASQSTVNRAIQENLEKGYLIRAKVGHHTGTNKPIYSYKLNTDLELEAKNASTETVLASTETVLAPSTETVLAPSTETVLTTIHIHDNNNTCVDDVELSEELNTQLDAIGLNGRARREIQCWDPDDVQLLLDRASEAENPAAWMAAWVLNGWDVERLGRPNPETPPDQERLCDKCRDTGGYVSTGQGWKPCKCWSKTKEVKRGRD